MCTRPSRSVQRQSASVDRRRHLRWPKPHRRTEESPGPTRGRLESRDSVRLRSPKSPRDLNRCNGGTACARDDKVRVVLYGYVGDPLGPAATATYRTDLSQTQIAHGVRLRGLTGWRVQAQCF